MKKIKVLFLLVFTVVFFAACNETSNTNTEGDNQETKVDSTKVETEKKDARCENLKKMREKVANSEKGYIPVFSLELISYEEKKGGDDIMTIAQLTEKGEDLIGKEVTIKGTADHICKHGGKKMHVIGSSEEERVVIFADDSQDPFPSETEGSDVVVVGKVKMKKIDSEYLDKWEKDLKEQIKAGKERKVVKDHDHDHAHSHDHDGATAKKENSKEGK